MEIKVVQIESVKTGDMKSGRITFFNKEESCNETQMIDVQYNGALYSLSKSM
jgi:hypothetical protein